MNKEDSQHGQALFAGKARACFQVLIIHELLYSTRTCSCEMQSLWQVDWKRRGKEWIDRFFRKQSMLDLFP